MSLLLERPVAAAAGEAVPLPGSGGSGKPPRKNGFFRRWLHSTCLACDQQIPLLNDYCSETCDMQHSRVPELAGL